MRLFRSPRARRLRLVLFALVFGVFVSICAAELVFRFWHGDRYKRIGANYWPVGSVLHDPALGWKYRPGSNWRLEEIEYEHDVSINSLGLRDREYGPKTKPRILFVGDSLTFGPGVALEQTFVKQAERRLESVSDVECINAGRIGAETFAYSHYVREYSRALDPDLIVLCLFPMNDFEETFTFQAVGTSRFRNVYGEVHVADGPMGRKRSEREMGFVYRNSALYRFLRLRFSRFAIGFSRTNIHRLGWPETFLSHEPEWVTSATRTVLDNIERNRLHCKEQGISLALVLIPSPIETNLKLQKRMAEITSREDGDYDFAKPFRVVTRYAREHDVPVLDLRPAVAASRRQLYFKHDGHFNARGHQLTGEQIAEFLISNSLAPDRQPRLNAVARP